jgi:NADPH-dependent curcumin reductase CurA
VSAAAGAVGSIAAQLAHLHGNRVIGSAGSPDKVKWLQNDLGLDHAFNYKVEEPTDALRRLAPDGIDVYFDGVGGSHLVAALVSLRRGGRVAMCGSVADYTTEPTGPRNLFLAVAKDIGLRGYRGSSNLGLLARSRAVIGDHLRAGRLIHQETVFEGLTAAPHALAALMSGATVGKTLVHL